MRAAFLGGALLALALVPTRFLEAMPSVCVFKNLFGVRCLGCGMTRALSALLHAHLATALAYNRLVVIVLPILCGIVLWDVSRLAAGWPASSCSPAETSAPARRCWSSWKRRP